MLPILQKYGLNINHVNRLPVFHYLVDSAKDKNHFNIYWRFLIENDVSPQVLNINGETLWFPLAKKLTHDETEIFSEEHFSLLEKNGISPQQLNFEGKNFAVEACTNLKYGITSNQQLLKK